MRILHVNKYLYRRGGAEGYAIDVAERQAQRGHDVTFFGMEHPLNPPLPLQDTFPPLVELDPPPPGLSSRLIAAGRMVWSPSSRAGMAEALARFRPEVVHLHNIYHQLSPSILGPVRRAGVPAVMTLHDYKLACPTYDFTARGEICQRCLDGRFRHAVEQRCKDGSLAASALLAVESRIHRTTGAYDGVSLFLCPSRFLATQMEVAGVGRGRLRVLSNPVDAASFSPQAASGRGVVVAGRLVRTKGFDLAVEAVGRLPGVTLDIAGEGPEQAALQELADRVAPGRVVFHGRLDKPALSALLRSAAVAVVPSRWLENMPLSVLEAMAVGLPVVVSDLGGLPEMVRDGQDGRVFRAEDAADLTRVLGELLGAPDELRALGARARARVLSDFDPDHHVDRLHELYAEAADLRS